MNLRVVSDIYKMKGQSMNQNPAFRSKYLSKLSEKLDSLKIRKILLKRTSLVLSISLVMEYFF